MSRNSLKGWKPFLVGFFFCIYLSLSMICSIFKMFHINVFVGSSSNIFSNSFATFRCFFFYNEDGFQSFFSLAFANSFFFVANSSILKPLCHCIKKIHKIITKLWLLCLVKHNLTQI
jgi:hypothetical protein